MNCEFCQENISLFLDNEHDETTSAAIQGHLVDCEGCAKMCVDFAAILDTVQGSAPLEVLPPNSHALWCRINNIIESEISQSEKESEKQVLPAGRWRFSFSQLGVAVAAVALISSLLTVVGLRNYFQPSGDDLTSRSAATQTTFEKVLVKVGLVESPGDARIRRLTEQRSAIDYWDKRVQVRRAQWDRPLREGFDRSIEVINQSEADYTQILERNPEDEISGEMLDSVLTEKMQLLREFSEL